MLQYLTIAFLLSFSFVTQTMGQIIAVGGSCEDKFLPTFVEMSGGKSANIYIMAAARIEVNDQIDTFKEYEQSFRDMGVKHITYDIILSKDDVDKSVVLSHISEATGICVSGGDQSILAKRILHTKFHKVLLDKMKSGMIYYGNSAGTAIIGDVMIYEEGGKLYITEGLSILDHIIFDTHFSERGRQNRLEKSLVGKDNYVGIGIDERTAVIFSNNKKEVIGEGKAHTYNNSITNVGVN